MIEVDDLRVPYGQREALHGVSLRAGPGELVGLLGPNGAGKTSLLRALCGLVAPSGGRVRVAGLDPRRQRTAVARRLGLVPQELAFYPSLSARQNLVFFGRIHGLAGAALRRAVAHALDLVQLADRAEERASALSGGLQRRLNVALGVLHEPEALVLDEPTTGVDARSRSALLAGFDALARGGTPVFYTTHLIDEAERLCRRVAVIDAGRIVADGTPADLVAEHGAATLRVRFDAPPPAILGDELVAAALARAARVDGCALELAASIDGDAWDPEAVLCYGRHAGSLPVMRTQKVTVHIDRDLLRRARERTREGVTGTIRQGLELVAASEAYERLRALRGKVKFSIDLGELREDRG